MLQKPKRHKNNKESHLQNRYPTDLRQSSNAIRVKFSRYKQNQIFTNVSFDTLIILSKKRPVVRSVDIATELDFKKPSVSVAMKKLRTSGHITVSPEGYINLTESGKEIATQIYERHVLLSSWLERLGVDPDIAAQDACRIEHVISSESFEALKKHIK